MHQDKRRTKAWHDSSAELDQVYSPLFHGYLLTTTHASSHLIVYRHASAFSPAASMYSHVSFFQIWIPRGRYII